MEQKDFILREIEKIGAMLRMFIRRRFEQKDTREEEQETAQVFSEFCDETGIDLDEINHLDKIDFPMSFNVNKGFNTENIELLADFLVELSKSSAAITPEKLTNKAIELYKYVDEISKTYSIERAAKIQKLEETI
jgi:hypothetical protein